MTTCWERQSDELEALLAIFEGDDEVAIEVTGLEALRKRLATEEEDVPPGLDKDINDIVVVIGFAFQHIGQAIPKVRVRLPSKYPNASPHIELGSKFLIDACQDAVREIVAEASTEGEECIFQVIQLLKEALLERISEGESGNAAPTKEDDESTCGRDEGWQPSNGEEAEKGEETALLVVHHGEPYTQSKSTFQAHCSAASSLKDVERMLSQLLSIKKITQATHNIMAYRIELENGGLVQDYDDDGESAAGGRLLHMMQAANALNVVVVVSRWYGGVKLGPSRFALINNVARQLLSQMGYIEADDKKASKSKKKVQKSAQK